MQVAIVNCVWDPQVSTAEGLIDHFTTLTGWAEAVRDAGVPGIVVCQRFSRDADIVRGGITYRFRTDGGAPRPATGFARADGIHAALAGADPDLVHVNGFEYPGLLRRLRRQLPARCALVVQDHGGLDPARLSWVRTWWLRRGLAATDAVLVASPGQVEAFRRAGLVPPLVRPRDVMESSTTLRPIGRRAGEGGRDGGSLALLWVGRFDRNKDPLTVVRGFAMFAERCKTATLTCVYRGGDLEPDVRAEISRHPELASRVRLVGEVPHAELPRHHAAADVFVLGSRYEGSGYAAIEALACGSIPALTDIPPFRALTDEGRVGTLWTAGDPASLRDALERIAARPLERERRAARALFEARFSWAAIGTRALAIYREAVDVRRTAPAGTP